MTGLEGGGALANADAKHRQGRQRTNIPGPVCSACGARKSRSFSPGANCQTPGHYDPGAHAHPPDAHNFRATATHVAVVGLTCLIPQRPGVQGEPCCSAAPAMGQRAAVKRWHTAQIAALPETCGKSMLKLRTASKFQQVPSHPVMPAQAGIPLALPAWKEAGPQHCAGVTVKGGAILRSYIFHQPGISPSHHNYLLSTAAKG